MSSAPGDKNCGTPRGWSGSSAQTAASPTTLRGAFFWCWSTKSCRGGKSHSPSSSVWSKQQCQALTGSRPISKLGRPSHTLHSVGHSHEQPLHRGRNRLCDSLSEPAASHPQLLNRRHLHGNVSCSIALICALLCLSPPEASGKLRFLQIDVGEESGHTDGLPRVKTQIKKHQADGRKRPCADRPIGDLARYHRAGVQVEPHVA